MSVARSLSPTGTATSGAGCATRVWTVGDKLANADSGLLEHAKYGIPLLPRLVCCGLNAKVNISSALITIVSLNASGDVSLTLKMSRQLQQFYLKSTPTGPVSADFLAVRGG